MHQLSEELRQREIGIVNEYQYVPGIQRLTSDPNATIEV
jgi:hypothetical protein